MAFNHQPYFLSWWTRERTRVATMLEPIRPSGGTAVYDAVLAAIPQFTVRNNQRGALVLISDGADTASDATLSEVRRALFRTDAFAYAVAIDSAERQAINTRVNPVALQEITDTSGGRTEVVHGTDDMIPAIARIAEELNSQYPLGYTSRARCRWCVSQHPGAGDGARLSRAGPQRLRGARTRLSLPEAASPLGLPD